tara:strand:- start:4 stop:525 length:522 start_codon:yes stop_codon:yes gene_type:complete
MSNKISTRQIASNFGLILSAYNVITGLLLVFLNLHYQNNYTIGLINLGVIIGVITYGIYYFKKSNDGFIKVSEALKTGIGISLVSGIISAVYSIILVYIIDPDFIEKTLEFQKKIMLEKDKNLTLENANKLVDLQKKLIGPFTTSGFIIIFNLFIGFIVSLIIGLIFNKSQIE